MWKRDRAGRVRIVIPRKRHGFFRARVCLARDTREAQHGGLSFCSFALCRNAKHGVVRDYVDTGEDVDECDGSAGVAGHVIEAYARTDEKSLRVLVGCCSTVGRR